MPKPISALKRCPFCPECLLVSLIRTDYTGILVRLRTVRFLVPKNRPRPMVKVPSLDENTPKSIYAPTLLNVKVALRPSSLVNSASMLPNVRQSRHSRTSENESARDVLNGVSPMGMSPVPPVQFLLIPRSALAQGHQ